MIWAPDGHAFAAVSSTEGVPAKTITRVFDGKTAAPIAASDPELDAYPQRWGPSGLVLRHMDLAAGGRVVYRTYSWRPGEKAKEMPAPAANEISSPDGKFRLVLEADAIRIEGQGERHRVVLVREEDREILGALPDMDLRWLGKSGLVLDLDAPMVLDLRNGKLRYIFPPGPYQLESASPDGRLLLARDDEGVLLWSRAEEP